MSEEECPYPTMEIKAEDIIPGMHAIWCTVGGSLPFANEIVSKRWRDNGRGVGIMLDSHNFDSFARGEMVEVCCLPEPMRLGDYLDNEIHFMESDPTLLDTWMAL